MSWEQGLGVHCAIIIMVGPTLVCFGLGWQNALEL